MAIPVITLDGVDVTEHVVECTIELVGNERATAQIQLEEIIPEEDQEFIAYGKDGVTPIFGGLVLDFTIKGVSDNILANIADVELANWERYLDWCSVSLSYDVATALEDVLADMVSPGPLGDYGLTYTPTATGIMLEPFSWVSLPAVEAIRQLRERTGLLITFNPDKSITTAVPGATPAPFQITDGANLLRLQKFDVSADPRQRGNKVVITFGPTGPGDVIEHTWVADGVATEFSLLGLNVRASDVWPGIVTIDGTPYPIWPAGGAPGGDGIEWANAVDDGTLSFLGAAWTALATAGAVIVLRYSPQFPFVLERDTGATPTKEVRLADVNTIDYGAAGEIADQALARIDRASARVLDIVTDEDDFEVGQLLTVNTTARGGVVSTFLIAALTITMIRGEHWEYAFAPTEGDVPQATYQDGWRQLTSGGGSSTSLSVVSGGGSSTSSGSGTAIRFPLGGSRSNSQAMGTTRTPVLDWQPFEAPADMTATVRVTCLTINAGQTVTPYLTKYNSGTMAWDIVATGTGTTSTTGAEQTFSAALTAGAFYRLEHVTDNAAGEACTIGQLQGVA